MRQAESPAVDEAQKAKFQPAQGSKRENSQQHQNLSREDLKLYIHGTTPWGKWMRGCVDGRTDKQMDRQINRWMGRGKDEAVTGR